MLKGDLFRKTIDQLAPTLSYLTFYFQGEPFLHPGFLEMVSYASGKGIYTATSTNAHFLSEEKARETIKSGLDRLIISIDGTSQETYESYRIGGQLERLDPCPAHNLLLEAKREGDVEIVVARRQTTKTGGYHTKPAMSRRIFSFALGLARELKAPVAG